MLQLCALKWSACCRLCAQRVMSCPHAVLLLADQSDLWSEKATEVLSCVCNSFSFFSWEVLLILLCLVHHEYLWVSIWSPWVTPGLLFLDACQLLHATNKHQSVLVLSYWFTQIQEEALHLQNADNLLLSAWIHGLNMCGITLYHVLFRENPLEASKPRWSVYPFNKACSLFVCSLPFIKS